MTIHKCCNILLTTLCLLLSVRGEAQLIITELMHANKCVFDEEKDLPHSWIELYNASQQPISLQNYQIQSNDNIYRIPIDTMMPAHSYLLIYCDKKGNGLHTQFTLPYKKESIVRLLTPQGDECDAITLPKQLQDGISFGRYQDQVGWMIEATPAAANSSVATQPAAKPQLTRASGLFTEGFIVDLLHPDTTIFFTTDGSEPTRKSQRWSSSLSVQQTTTLKLKNIPSATLPSPTVCYDYLLPDHAITLPVISLTTDPNYLYDNQIGILSDGGFPPDSANYQNDWHRTAHFSYFSTEGKQWIDQEIQLRIAGGSSRLLPIKSMILYSKGEYGHDTFEHQFWKEKPKVTHPKSILLRNAGNDFLLGHMRDAVIQSYFGQYMDNLDYQAYQPVIVYINGEYVGLMNIRERTNDDYISQNYDGLTNVDVIENWVKINHGDEKEALKLYHLISKTNVTYDELEQEIDIDELINLLIAEIYSANVDFPDNNIVMWREKKEGGRWRWILKDLDMSWDLIRNDDGTFPTFNFFNQVINITPESELWELYGFTGLLFRQLMGMKPFQEKFGERFIVNMGDYLHPRYFHYHVDSIAQQIEYEFPFTYDRYSEEAGITNDWYHEIEIIKQFPSKRNWLNAWSMQQHFQWGELYHLTINDPFANDLPYHFSFNNIDMFHTSYEGYYYKDRNITIRTQKTNSDAPDIQGWKINWMENGITLSEIRLGKDLEYSIPSTSTIADLKIEMITQPIDSQEYDAQKRIHTYLTKEGLVIAPLSSSSEITLCDLTGKIYFHQKGFTDKSILIDYLPHGVYLLTTEYGTEKVIK